MSKLWEFVVRFRNWLVTIGGTLLLMLPDIVSTLGSPELLAVLPAEYHRWLAVLILVLNLAMRWRPAVLPTDPEAEISRLRKAAGDFKGENV